jgi:hypothetical protein
MWDTSGVLRAEICVCHLGAESVCVGGGGGGCLCKNKGCVYKVTGRGFVHVPVDPAVC